MCFVLGPSTCISPSMSHSLYQHPSFFHSPGLISSRFFSLSFCLSWTLQYFKTEQLPAQHLKFDSVVGSTFQAEKQRCLSSFLFKPGRIMRLLSSRVQNLRSPSYWWQAAMHFVFSFLVLSILFFVFLSVEPWGKKWYVFSLSVRLIYIFNVNWYDSNTLWLSGSAVMDWQLVLVK